MVFNVGIIGLGMIGKQMLSEFLEHDAFHVTAAWDRNPAANQHIIDQYPNVHIATDAAAIINDDTVDVVYIATPPTSHVPRRVWTAHNRSPKSAVV